MTLKRFFQTVAELALLTNGLVVFANLFALLAYSPVLADPARFALLVTTHATATFLTAGLFTDHAPIKLWPSRPGLKKQQASG